MSYHKKNCYINYECAKHEIQIIKILSSYLHIENV